MHGLAIAADERNLNGEIVGHGRALRFVGSEKLVAEGGRGNVEDNREIVRMQILVLSMRRIMVEKR